jgi:hypothetical protein
MGPPAEADSTIAKIRFGLLDHFRYEGMVEDEIVP